ncbi:transposase [Rhizobium ruizarguesonis]|uniref:IS66 family transposase n=1 Tax=Rhizobium ruizarguesonis TaxID=2081791 RepID=UPI0037CAA4D9
MPTGWASSVRIAPRLRCIDHGPEALDQALHGRDPCPVFDPSSRKTKTGYFWALARDDRPWNGGALPQVSPSPMLRVGGGLHAERILQGFSGILQVDGYAGYNRLIT